MRFENDDKLKREIYATKINRLIDISNEIKEDKSSFVIALDSSWGTGKTTFIEMWRNMNYVKENYKISIYNAWKNDDFDKPLISILSDILDQLDNGVLKKEQRAEIKRKAFEISKYVAKKGISYIIKNKLGVDVSQLTDIITDRSDGLIEKEDISKVLGIIKSKEADELFAEYKEFKEIKGSFLNLLEEVSINKKFVFVIDELDRCNPLYAIKVLETMKHFFNNSNIVFMLAVDIEQLSHSIATVYGQNMDSQGYLRRFFDIQLRLPEPKSLDYISYMLDLHDIKLEQTSKNELVQIVNKLKLSLRDINRIILNISVMLKISGISQHTDEYLIIYIYLMTLKYKYPYILNIVLNERFLNEGNDSNGSYNILEDKFYKTTPIVEEFMKSIMNGQMQETVNTVNKRFILTDEDKLLPEFDSSLPLNKLLERKLELYY
ncbi:P-loop NTPase fold protein [Clostridiaceae bacterium M8S5]|nr:P-loop NTPase fold protein [Clostridiaceae bacterium M8S5]